MKIHPLFEEWLLNMNRPAMRDVAIERWCQAGKPVIMDEPPTCKHGTLLDPVDSCMACAHEDYLKALETKPEGKDFPFKLDNGNWINLRGTINLDVYPEIRRAILREHMTTDDIGDVELLENDTIARIAIRGRGKPHHVGLGYSGGQAYDVIQRKVIRPPFKSGMMASAMELCRNAALEEAAKLAEGFAYKHTGAREISTAIRELKR